VSPRKGRPAPDPRHAAVKQLLAKYWAAENPQTPDLPWGAAEAGCVGAFLRANPSVGIDVIERCLNNRMKSEDHAPGEGVYRWFRDLLRYSAAPLDRYRLPKRIHSEATVGMDAAANVNADPDSSDDSRDRYFRDKARDRKAKGMPLTDWEKVLLAEVGEL
jgi:hypothetical protein